MVGRRYGRRYGRRNKCLIPTFITIYLVSSAHTCIHPPCHQKRFSRGIPFNHTHSELSLDKVQRSSQVI